MQQTFRSHFVANLRIAFPVSLGQLGIMVAGLADSLMLGQIGYHELAAASLANAIQVVFLFFGSGSAIALTTLVGFSYGQKDTQTLKNLFRDGLTVNFGFGILLSLLTSLVVFNIQYLGQDPLVASLAKNYALYLAATMWPHMLFMHFKQFTEGMQKPVPGMVFGFTWNLLNIFLNWILIFGHWGAPAMGIEGAGLATFLSRVAAVVFFMLYFYFRPKYCVFLRELYHFTIEFKVVRKLLAVGIPIGAQFSMEAGAFATSALMMGWLGADIQAAHQITINLASTTYMLASGIGAAATIRISKLFGEGNKHGVYLAGQIAFVQVLLLMSAMALIFIFGRFWLPSFFVQEPTVISISAQLLVVAAIFQIFDGAQVAGLGTQRGLGDVRYPTLIALIAYWLIGIPIGYTLGFQFNLSGVGIWLGLAIGLALTATMLYWRFLYFVKHKLN